MATLKQLYELVHSLDKAEKKNLSLLVEAMGGKGRKRYSNALHIINEQKIFDAEKLKRKLGADVNGMSLTEANDYVFNFICKFLIGQNVASTGNLGLLKEMILVETFVAKGLFELAAKYLEPLLEKLQNGNSFGLLSRGLELHTIVTASNPTTTRDHKKRATILQTRMQAARDQLQYVEVIQLSQKIFQLVDNYGEPRDKKELLAYQEIYKHPVWSLDYSQISRQAFTMYAPLRNDMVNIIKGTKTAITECKLALAEFRKRFDVRDHYVLAFYLLDNLLSDYMRVKEASEMLPYIEELRQLLPHVKQKAVSQKIHAKIMQCELGVCIINKEFPQGVKRLGDWMKPERKSTWDEAPLAYMNYMFGARLHYMNGQPQLALDYLHMVQDREKFFRAASFISYRFLYLLCYYQLDNPSLVHSTANSIYKSLLKQEKLHAPERAILRFAKASGTVEKLKKNIRELHTSLKALSHDPLHVAFFQFADYVEWLEMEVGKKR